MLERWLAELGARQRGHHSCEWDLITVAWSAELALGSEELTVRWVNCGPFSTLGEEQSEICTRQL